MDCGQFDSVSESHRNAASTDDLIEAGLDKASEISSASDHVKYFGVLCCTDRTYCQDKKYLELDEILVRFDQALEDYCSQNSVNTWMGLRAATILESTMDHSNTTEFKNGVCSFLASNTTICFGSHGFRNELPVWQRMCRESKAANVKFLCSTNPRWYANMYAEHNICDAAINCVCRTGPYPLDSMEANSMIASLASIASSCDLDDQVDIFLALYLWDCRRANTAEESAQDKDWVLAMFRYYLAMSIEGKLIIYSGEREVLALCQANRPIYDVTDGAYEQLLRNCKSSHKDFIAKHMAAVFRKYGNDDDSRKQLCLEAFRDFRKRYLKTNYQEHVADNSFEIEIERKRDLTLFWEDLDSEESKIANDVKIRKWQERDALFDQLQVPSKDYYFGLRDDLDVEEAKRHQQCRRELALMAPFGMDDRRRLEVLSAVKSLKIPDALNQLQEWDSRRDAITSRDEINQQLSTFESGEPHNALQTLRRLRLENPALVFGKDIRMAARDDDQTKAKRKRQVKGAPKPKSAARKSKKAKCDQEKQADRDNEAESELSDGDNKESNNDKEKAGDSEAVLICMLENLEISKTGLRAAICAIRHLDQKNEKYRAVEKCMEMFSCQLKSDEDRYCLMEYAYSPPVVDWGPIYKECLKVQLSPHKLITHTLQEFTGCAVKSYRLIDRSGFKTLQFVSDCIPQTEHTLSLSKGCIDDDESKSLAPFRLDSEFVEGPAAQALIKSGIARRIGLVGKDEYHQHLPKNGKWGTCSEAEATDTVRKELLPYFTRTLHLREFKEAVRAVSDKTECTGSMTSYQMQIVLDKYCNSSDKAKKVLQLLSPSIRFTPKRHPNWLLAKNGIIDLQTGKLIGPALPEDCITCSVPHSYEPDIDVSIVERYISSFFPPSVYPDAREIQEFIQRFFGSCLTTHKSEPMFLNLVGAGGKNGKSELCELLEKTFGLEICGMLSAESLSKQTGQNNDTLKNAIHCRFCVVSETNRTVELNDKLVKGLTGHDKVEVKGMYNAAEMVKAEMKLLVFSNKAPKFQKAGERAIERRSAYCPMLIEFLGPNDAVRRKHLESSGLSHYISPQDSEFRKKLGQEVCKKFLVYAVRGAVQVFDPAICSERVIPLPTTIMKYTEEIHRVDCEKKEELTDFLVSFIEETGDNKDFIPTQEMYYAYVKYTEVEAGHIMVEGFNEFSQRIAEKFNQLSPVPLFATTSKTRRKALYGDKAAGYTGLKWTSIFESAYVAQVRKRFLDSSSRGTAPDISMKLTPSTEVVRGLEEPSIKEDNVSTQQEERTELATIKSVLLGPSQASSADCEMVYLGSEEWQCMEESELSDEEAHNLVWVNMSNITVCAGGNTYEVSDAQDGKLFKLMGESERFLKIGTWSHQELQGFKMRSEEILCTIHSSQVGKMYKALESGDKVCLNAVVHYVDQLLFSAVRA
jgi:phage/plasmid-associated DNA primase